MIYYLTKDLMMASNVQAVARQNQIELKLVGSMEKLLELASQVPAVRTLVDLQTPGLTVDAISSLVKQLTDLQGTVVPVVGYAQHVHVDLIKVAAESGFSAVVTRGQMHHNAAEFLV